MNIEGYKDVDCLPANLRVYGASDYATMEPTKGKREPDFTEHGTVGIDSFSNLWFIDWWFGQVETDKGIAQFIRLIKAHKPVRWWHEGGLIDKAIGPAIRREMRDNRAFVSLEALPSLMDKGMKLQAFHARCSARTVHFPLKRRWTERVIEQLIKFPAGRWDDAADVCGLIGRGIDQMVDPFIPVAQKKPNLVPYSGAWIEYDDGRDKPKERFFP